MLWQLWLLFHSLLVRAPPHAAAGVLTSIRGYVEHFFGCADCAGHFLALTSAADDPMPPPTADGDAALLWLWRAHNKVNLRLNATGERAVLRLGLRKEPFPTRTQCPDCFGAQLGQWHTPNMLGYLRRAYCQPADARCP